MREILFKAKRKDNGKWVEGYYQKRFDTFGNIEHLIFYSKSSIVWGYVEIDINTLCQYTGLTDKNGNKIWENDIVIGDFGYVKGRYTIRWFDSKSKFDFPTDAIIIGSEYEVIGNIFDNPELLKEGAK